jgi:hypothetical protein
MLRTETAGQGCGASFSWGSAKRYKASVDRRAGGGLQVRGDRYWPLLAVTGRYWPAGTRGGSGPRRARGRPLLAVRRGAHRRPTVRVLALPQHGRGALQRLHQLRAEAAPARRAPGGALLPANHAAERWRRRGVCCASGGRRRRRRCVGPGRQRGALCCHVSECICT